MTGIISLAPSSGKMARHSISNVLFAYMKKTMDYSGNIQISVRDMPCLFEVVDS